MPGAYVKSVVKTIPNYPKDGIMFRDVTSILENHQAFSNTIELFVEQYQHKQFDKVAGTEARGFIFGAPLALALGIGFVPIRKPNKLPRKTISEAYELEYGTDELEIHEDSIQAGERVLLVDDLLATGGTMLASASLVKRLGGIVEDACFVINLPDIGGQAKLEAAGITPYSICEFEGD